MRETGERSAGEGSAARTRLRFGDVWCLSRCLRALPLERGLRVLPPGDADSLRTLLCHRQSTGSTSMSDASAWRSGSAASLLYPQARLSREDVRAALTRLGTDGLRGRFCRAVLAEALRREKTGRVFFLDIQGEETALAAPGRPVRRVSLRGDGRLAAREACVLVLREGEEGLRSLGLFWGPEDADPGRAAEAALEEALGAVGELLPEGFPLLALPDGRSLGAERLRELSVRGIPFAALVTEGPLRKVFAGASLTDTGEETALGERLLRVAAGETVLAGERLFLQRWRNPSSSGASADPLFLSSMPMAAGLLRTLAQCQETRRASLGLARGEQGELPRKVLPQALVRGYRLFSFLAGTLREEIERRLDLGGRPRTLGPDYVCALLGNHLADFAGGRIVPDPPDRRQAELYALLGITPPSSLALPEKGD